MRPCSLFRAETLEPKVANTWGIDKGQAFATVNALSQSYNATVFYFDISLLGHALKIKWQSFNYFSVIVVYW